MKHTCETCLHFLRLYKRHGTLFISIACGQCDFEKCRKKEIKHTSDSCQKWEDSDALTERKKQGIAEILCNVKTNLATVEALLNEIK